MFAHWQKHGRTNTQLLKSGGWQNRENQQAMKKRRRCEVAESVFVQGSRGDGRKKQKEVDTTTMETATTTTGKMAKPSECKTLDLLRGTRQKQQLFIYCQFNPSLCMRCTIGQLARSSWFRESVCQAAVA